MRGNVVLCVNTLASAHEELSPVFAGMTEHTMAARFEGATWHTMLTGAPVLDGAQRPSSALSTDAGLNLVNAIRVAASPEARGRGVLVVLNDEIQAVRDVTKTATLQLQTFRTADFGVLGHADGDAVAFYRRPIRQSLGDRLVSRSCRAARSDCATVWPVELHAGWQTGVGQHVIRRVRVDLGDLAA
jgi:L-asparaginase